MKDVSVREMQSVTGGLWWLSAVVWAVTNYALATNAVNTVAQGCSCSCQ
jgi:hypothetical protein